MTTTSPYIEKKRREFPCVYYVPWYNPKRMTASEELRRTFPGGLFSWSLDGGGQAFAFRTADELARFGRDFVARWRTQL